MRLRDGITTFGKTIVVVAVWGCAARPNDEGPGFGTVGGGGGTEVWGSGSSGSESSGFGSSGHHESSGAGSASGGGSGASASGESGASGGSSGAGGHISGGSGSAGSGSGSSGSSGTSGSGGTLTDAGDAGTGGLHLSLGGPLHLVSLHWTITGPNTYGGSVEFGDAQSVEWVVGGIRDGSGYTLSVTATDTFGDPCDGVSSPFSVDAGTTTYTVLTITCHTRDAGVDPADVTSGSVAIEAGVVSSD